MTMGLPGGGGWQNLPAYQPGAPNAGYAPDDPWLGVYLVGGVAALSLGLLTWHTVSSARARDVLQGEVAGVDRRLSDYQRAHALVHAALVQDAARARADLQAQIDDVRAGRAEAPPASMASASAPSAGGGSTLRLPPQLERALTAALASRAPPSGPEHSVFARTLSASSARPSAAWPLVDLGGAALPSVPPSRAYGGA